MYSDVVEVLDEKLKPCPFCGCRPDVGQIKTVLNGHKYWAIKHQGCCFVKDESGYFSTKEKAMQAWNMRR